MNDKSVRHQERIILFLVCLLMSLIGFFVYIHKNSHNALDSIKSNLTYSLDTNSSLQILDETLEDAETNASIFADVAKKSFSSKFINDKQLLENYLSSLDNLISQITLKTDWSDGVWLQINPEIALNDHSLCNWYHYEGKKLIKHKKEYAELNEVDDSYYFETVKAKKPIWTDVYEDPFIKEKMITYSIPLYKNEVLIGVAGIDISLDGLYQILERIHYEYEGSELYLIKNDSKVVSMYPYDPNTVNRKLFSYKKELEFLKEKIKQSENIGNITYKSGLNDRIAVFSQLSNHNYLIITVPASTIYKKFNALIFLSYIMFSILAFLTLYALFGRYKLLNINNKLEQQTSLLIKSEKEKNLILNSVSEVISYIDLDFKVKWTNNSSEKIFNLSSEQIVDEYCYKRHNGQTHNCPDCPVKKAILTRSHQKIERKTFDNKHLIISAVPVINKDNEVIGAVETIIDITDQKNLEDSLLENKAQQQAILDNIPFIAWLKDREGKFITVNEQYAKIFNLNVMDFVGKVELDFWPEDVARTRIIENQEVMLSGKQKSVEEEISRFGQVRWFETFITPVFNEIDEVVGTTGLARDITYRKLIEQELMLKDKLLSAVAKALNELVRNYDFDSALLKTFDLIGTAINVDRIYIFENSFNKDLNTNITSQKYEWTSQSAIPQINNPELQNIPFNTIDSFISPLTQNTPLIGLLKDFDSGIKEVLESQNIMSLMVFPIFIEDYFWGFVGFDECKTERIWTKAEQAILSSFSAAIAGVIERNQKKEKEKSRIKQELEIALRHADLGLWYWNIKTGHVDFSDSLVEMLGYKIDEIEPDISMWEKWLFEDDTEKAYKTLNDYIKGKTDKYELECRVKTKSGDIKWILDQGEIIERDKEGNPLIMTGTHIDITERKKIQEILLQNEKMISIGELAAGMAHEINNPLGGILLGCYNINKRISPDLAKNIEVAKECNIEIKNLNLYLQKRDLTSIINNIQSLGERASDIINDMLSFSRKSSSTFEQVNLCELLDKSIELVSSDFNLKKGFDFKQVNIIKEYQTLPLIKGKKIELEQVFLNLLKNAAQSMPENHTQPTIIIRTFKQDNFIRVEIEDNGFGMDDISRKRVFEPFYTTKDVGFGTGLGLSVSYFIITDTHKGKISVESALEKGTIFTIDLPLE